jgi:hypothetical protein
VFIRRDDANNDTDVTGFVRNNQTSGEVNGGRDDLYLSKQFTIAVSFETQLC